MERILVAMNGESTNLWAGIHALNLARRIRASVSFLLVLSPITDKGEDASTKKKMETLIEEARAEGVKVDYYVAYGDYESELITFIQDNKTTLLVVGPPGEGESSEEVFTRFLEKIRHRIDCRIEVIHEKPPASDNSRKGDKDVVPVSTNRRE